MQKTHSDRLRILSSKLDSASRLLNHAAITKTSDRLSTEISLNFITQIEEKVDTLIETIISVCIEN